MIREGAIDFTKQFDYFAAQPAIKFGRQHTGDTIAAVNNDLDRPGKFDVSDDSLQIALYDVMLTITPLSVLEVSLLDTQTQ